MIERIPNPYKQQWKEFDIEEFKEDICDLIDEIIYCKDEEEMDFLVDDLDDEFIYLLTLLRFKDSELLDVINISTLSVKELQKMGFTKEDIENLEEDKYIICEQAEEQFKKNKTKELTNKRGWTI